MGRIVYAAAMSHVLDPDYYGTHCGPRGRQMVQELMALVGEMGTRMAAAEPDALVVVADDHLNVFSFNAVPALCVRIDCLHRQHAIELYQRSSRRCRCWTLERRRPRSR